MFIFDNILIDTKSVNNPEAPYDLVKTMRASFYVLGPLIARFGYVKVSLQLVMHGDLGLLIII